MQTLSILTQSGSLRAYIGEHFEYQMDIFNGSEMYNSRWIEQLSSRHLTSGR